MLWQMQEDCCTLVQVVIMQNLVEVPGAYTIKLFYLTKQKTTRLLGPRYNSEIYRYHAQIFFTPNSFSVKTFLREYDEFSNGSIGP